MARPTGWVVLGLDGDPTPGVVETVQGLAKQFGDFAHDVQSAYGSLNSFGADTTALGWVGQTAEAFKGQFGPLPGRLQKAPHLLQRGLRRPVRLRTSAPGGAVKG
jgi:uncharacterized protein YukE